MDPNNAPIVLVSTISIGNGNEPPFSWTSNSLAFSALKLPLIVADPPVIPVLANWLPTLASLIDSPSRMIAIILDGESISEASVGNQFANTGITGGSATISGNFSAENARELEVQLKGGSLPLPIEIVETNTIGALLGSKNILKSLYAAA